MQDRLALLSLTLVFDKLCQCGICFTSKESPTTDTRLKDHLLRNRKVDIMI